MVSADTTRIVRVITRLNIGGPARQALLLTRALEPDFTTTLLAGTPAADEGELGDPDVHPERVPLVRPPRPVDDLRALAAVRSVIQRDRPAIVHTHMAKAGTVARLAARSARRRPLLVHTFHGHVLEGYFSRAVAQGYVLAERALARATDALVAVSTEVRDDLLELGIGSPDRWHVIPLGLDLRAHAQVRGRSGALRERFGIADDVPLAGLVGRLVPIKDPEMTLRAVARVPGLHLAVVGDGELREQVRQRAAELGIADRTHLTGWVTDVPSVMADLDFAVLSSRNEGTPVALIEAAACARASIATDGGGVRSVVEHDVTGIVVPAGDDAALAEAMSALAGDAARRAAMGAAGRARSSRWSDERLVRDIAALYRGLLDQR
jgi:glycosyltransferase involved in cell wall biosynthesis